MATITQLQGALIADLVYNDLSTLVNQLNETEDANHNKYTTLAFYSDPTTDLQMALLQYGDRKVVAFRGTESELDILTNLDMYVYLEQAGVAHQFIQAGVTLSQWISDYNLSSGNTTIVGHSLGGALAQYFGANTEFETLTYNAYGIGNELSGSSSNITNYITMHDPVSILPGSQMVGTTYMLQDETLTGALGHGISNFTSENSWVRGYSIVSSPRDIDVIDGIGSSGLDSIYEAALRLSEGREFAMINGSMDDVIFGGDINNTLISGGGKDTLIGGKGFDRLQGGADYDTYITDNGDMVTDDLEGKGIVYFEGELLSGGTKDAGSGCAPHFRICYLYLNRAS